MNTLSIDLSGIRLIINDPNDWPLAEHLAGSCKVVAPGVFEYTASALNLQRIFTIFTGPKRPQVVNGQWLINKRREELAAYIKATNETERICGLERLPVEPNGKFVPYSHQSKIIGIAQKNPFSGIMADCGLGKTGSLARTIELEIERGSVMRGKILISAPLSILETSWLDDIKKFTNLKAGLLWLNIANKDILGEEQVIFDYGEKPADTVSVRTQERTLYRNPAGRIIQKVTTIDKPQGPWERFKAKVKVASNTDGVKTPFGPVLARTAVKEETKKIELKRMLADPTYDLFLINHDGVKIYEEELEAHEFAWVVVDESTKIKSPSSQVWKSHVQISWRSRRRNVLTGTPNPNGFIDL
jgi:SNF2 family DNA or RNA helicase